MSQLESPINQMSNAWPPQVIWPLLLDAEDIDVFEDFAVYPNPSTGGVLNVVFAHTDFHGRLEIADAQGRLVFQKNDATANESLHITALPAGTYSLRATDATGKTAAVRKFSKI